MLDQPPFLLLFFVFLAACFGAGATGALFPPGAWYQSLKKPWFTPPNWAFPLAWTSLYLCMSASAARIAGELGGPQGAAAGLALAAWALQIALNTLWTPVFFGLRRMVAAMVVLVLLWLAVAATMLLFWRIDWVAGLLFLPYLSWVTVAGALNLRLWQMNPGASA